MQKAEEILLQQILTRQNESAESRGKLHKKVDTLTAHVEALEKKAEESLKMLRGDGNGESGVLHRLTIAQKDRIALGRQLREIRQLHESLRSSFLNHKSELSNSDREVKKEKVKGYFGIIIASLSALGLSIAAFLK